MTTQLDMANEYFYPSIEPNRSGMLPVDDVAIQLVDLPSSSPEHPIPWIGNALQTADAAAFVVDLSRPGCVEQVVLAHEILAVQCSRDQTGLNRCGLEVPSLRQGVEHLLGECQIAELAD